MDPSLRPKALSERLHELTLEKVTFLEALERAATDSISFPSLNKLDDPTVILQETAHKIRDLFDLDALCFYLVDEESADFYQSYCDPPEFSPCFEQESAALINEGSFSWALRTGAPLKLSSTDDKNWVLLHALNTSSRSRGMFFAMYDKDVAVKFELAYPLLSLYLRICAGHLESFELYHQITKTNDRLEQDVAERTRDLRDSNDELQKEIVIRERAQAALTRERDFITAILDTAAALVIVLDKQGRIWRFNRACEHTTGYRAEDVYGKKVWELFIPEEQRDGVLSVFEELRAGDFPNEHENIWLTSTGEERIISWSNSALLDKNGDVEYVIGTGIDVTEKVHAEAKAKEAEQTYKNIFDHAVEGIFVADAEGFFIQANTAMALMLGFDSPQDLLNGPRPRKLQIEHKFEERFFRELFAERQVSNFEMRILRKSGQPFWVSLSARAICDANDSVSSIEGLAEDITERKIFELHLQRQATMDELTGVPNRYLFLDRFETMLAQAGRLGHTFAMLYIDLDKFKPINDEHGHAVGDLLLKEVSARLKNAVRQSDTLARIGGDEFALLLYNAGKPTDVRKIASKIISTLSKPYSPAGVDCMIGVSIGVSIYPHDGQTPEELLEKADTAMYWAKEVGGNEFYFYDPACVLEE